MKEVARGYDVVGNIVVVKFSRDAKAKEKKAWASTFLRNQRSVRTVLEKLERFKGRLRVQKTRHLAGEKTKEALYKENGCVFRFNVDTCYFSPRLAAERKEIAKKVKKGEKVLVLFGGVAPFAIVIARTGKPRRVVSIELSRACTVYAKENVKRNKVEGIVEIVQGDVRKKVPLLRERFDRIVMARPNLNDSFLDSVFPKANKGCIIHYYGFCHESELEGMKFAILVEARGAGKKIKIFNVEKAGDIGARKYRYRLDIKVLN
ncbi:MAG TPA: hypothetical protein VJK03_04155 [Candidatus Nanoarchaeia archaeon]|nr:hypothetical protein [Candidatus Nanoarchaeia archaeon]